jgi:hypothetical protein
VPGTGPRRIVLVGRLSERKGTDVAVEAVALLRGQGRDVTLELCGAVFPGYEWFEERLRERAAAPDLDGAVTFSGYTDPTWPALGRAEVVLVPSRAEPFGNTAVEAQLAARPVVASAVQGLQEIVTPGETGLLVPPGDPRALGEALVALAEDPARGAAMGRAGRAAVEDRWTWEETGRRIVDALSDRSASGGRRRTPTMPAIA